MRTILYLASSLNGYIAHEDDSTDWSELEWRQYQKFCAEVGNLIIGRRTYEIMQAQGEFDRLGPLEIVVVSHKQGSGAGASVAPSPEAALKHLEQCGFRQALVGGGGTLARSFLKGGLLDEIVIDLEPVLFSAGVPILAGDIPEIALGLLKYSSRDDGGVQLHYRILRPAKRLAEG